MAHALEEKANLKAQLDKQQKDDNAAQKAAADAATQVQQDLAAKLKQATAELKDREETVSPIVYVLIGLRVLLLPSYPSQAYPSRLQWVRQNQNTRNWTSKRKRPKN